MAFTVVYDACVLYPAPLRELLVRLAQTGVFRARWTEAILDEVFRNIVEDRPDLSPERLARTRSLLGEAIRDVLVVGWEELVDGLALPDPDDRHVLAAAIRGGAQAIVTFNLRDFPRDPLAGFGVEAVHPDDFVLDLLDLAPGAVLRALTEQAGGLRNPPVSMPDLLNVLEAGGLPRAVAECRRMFGHS